MRPLGVAGDLRFLPRAELRISLFKRLARLCLKLRQFLLDRDRALVRGERLQLGNLALKLGNGFLEIEIGTHF
jgi:hypothetical protein